MFPNRGFLAAFLFGTAVHAFQPLYSPSLSGRANLRIASGVTALSMKAPSITKFESMKLKYNRYAGESKVDDVGFDYSDFDAAISKFETKFQVGDIVVGQIVQFEQKGALVDVGGKASAFLQTTEASMFPVLNLEDCFSIGETREFQIISGEDESGQLQLSVRRIEIAITWERVRQIQAEDCIIRAEILSINRGGALIMYDGLRGFLPGSHAPKGLTEDMIGNTLPFKFLEVDQVKNRLVVSHRLAVLESQLRDINPGEVVSGVVRGIKTYGAFVDIGGLSGLLHISQISHDHISDVEAVLTVGMELKAMVISQDKEKGRFSLSTKCLEPEPGDMIRDPSIVFTQAEAMAARYHERIASENKAREEAASELVAGLDLESLDIGP